jgi:hypothetical protein
MWSLTQSDSKPADSSVRAIVPIPTACGSGPLFGTFAPMRTTV